MAHFLGAELTKELENLNADVNTNDNSEVQQNQETNTQDNEENGNANDKTTDEEIIDEEMRTTKDQNGLMYQELGDIKLQLQQKT